MKWIITLMSGVGVFAIQNILEPLWPFAGVAPFLFVPYIFFLASFFSYRVSLAAVVIAAMIASSFSLIPLAAYLGAMGIALVSYWLLARRVLGHFLREITITGLGGILVYHIVLVGFVLLYFSSLRHAMLRALPELAGSLIAAVAFEVGVFLMLVSLILWRENRIQFAKDFYYGIYR